MSTGIDAVRTNEVPGVRARLSHARFSAYKAREVLDLVRGEPVAEARTILDLCDRDAALPIAKLLDSAVANRYKTYDGELIYTPASTASHTITLTLQRTAGSGTFDILSGADYPIEVDIIDEGRS